MRFFLFFISIFLFQEAYCIDITVKTSFESKNSEGVSVFVYSAKDNISKDKYLFKSLTDKDGIAKVSIPEGKYFFIAEKKLKDGYLLGYYGLNPINIKESQTLSMILVKYPNDYIKEIKEKKIEGIVLYNGKPVENVGVYLYLDLSSELKGPPYLYAVSDERGFFEFDISEGSYYLIFRKKQNSSFGPPSSGDYIGFFPKFPLVIDKKGVKITANLFKIPEKRELSKNINLYEIKGKIIGKEGEGLEKFYVGLYDNRELLGKPVYVSNPTDSNGFFTIYVKEKGSYYIGIRSKLGDTPEENERVYYFEKIDITDEKKEYYLEITLD